MSGDFFVCTILPHRHVPTLVDFSNVTIKSGTHGDTDSCRVRDAGFNSYYNTSPPRYAFNCHGVKTLDAAIKAV